MEKCSPEQVGMSPFDLNRMDTLFEEARENHGLPGFAAAVARDGKICYQNSWGYPLDALYRIYSMTKPITVTGFLRLYEHGLCTLDDPVEKFIPAYGKLLVMKDPLGSPHKTEALKSPLKIRHLLTMSSGLSYGFFPHRYPLDKLYMQRMWRNDENAAAPTRKDFIDELATFPLAFQPGSSYCYSLSLDVLSRVIEVITQKSFEDFITEEILSPLEMDETFFDPPEEMHSRIPAMHRMENGTPVEVFAAGDPRTDIDPGVRGGAGLYSTLHDYLRFTQMLQQGGSLADVRILGRKTVQLMATGALSGHSLKVFQENWPGYNYGLGVRVLENPGQWGVKGSIGEFGWDGAAGAWMMADPVEKISAVLFQHTHLAQNFGMARRFQQIIYSSLL